MQAVIGARWVAVSRADEDALTHKLEPLLPLVVETTAVLSREQHRPPEPVA